MTTRTALLLAASLCGLAALATAAWQGGADVGLALGTPRPGTLRLAQNATGGAVAVWTESAGGVARTVAARFDGASWGAPAAIDGAPGVDTTNPDVSIGPDGRAMAVFEVHDAESRIHAARFDGADWLAPTPIDAPTDTSATAAPHVSCGDGGRAAACWIEGAQFVARTFDGTGWEEPAASAASFFDPTQAGAVAMDASGRALAVFAAADGLSARMFALAYSGGAWTGPTAIDTDPGFGAFSPSIGMDGAGNAVAVWVHDPGDIWRAKAATYTPEGGWAAASLIDVGPPEGGFNATRPHVAVGPGPRAIAAFLKDGDGGDRVWAAVYDGAAWGPATDVGGGDVAGAPCAAIDVAGRGFVAFQDETLGEARAARWDGSAFGAAESILDGLSGVASSARVAAGPAGTGLAAFLRTENDATTVSATRFSSGPTPPAPVLAKLAAPSFAPGGPLTITGKNFGAAPGTVVVDGLPARVTKWTKKKIVVVLPNAIGDADVVVRTAQGVSGTKSVVFVAPTLKSVKVGKPKNGLSIVTLKGKAFGLLAAGSSSAATVGGDAHGVGDAAVLKWTDAQIKLRVAVPSGTTDFRVRTSPGQSAVVQIVRP